MSLLYLDASALVKLVRAEPESAALHAYLAGADVVASSLVLAEVPRALRRAVLDDDRLTLEDLVCRSGVVLDAVAMLEVDDAVLVAAGALAEPRLRALDAIHVAAAITLQPLDAFVSYDHRQSAVARLVGLRTVAPGDA